MTAPRILLVEPDAAARVATLDLLESSGHAVVAEGDLERALESARVFKPDIVLLTLHRTDASASGCAALRRLPETRRVPIIILTDDDSDERIDNAFAAGADDFLRIPLRRQELLPRLGAHLRSKRLLDELDEQTSDHRLLVELWNTLAGRFEIRQILRTIASRLAETIHVDRCSIVLIEPDRSRGFVVAASEDPLVQDVQIDLRKYPEILEVMDTQAPLVVADAESHPLFSEVKVALASRAVRASILFPMLVQGDVIGVLLLRSSRPLEDVSARELGIGQTVASATAIAVRNARLFESIAEESVRLDVERREVSERLEAVSRFQDFIEHAADGMLTMDEHGTINYLNQAAAEVLRLPPGQGGRVDLFSLVEPYDHGRVRELIANSGRSSRRGSFDVAVRVSGEVRQLSASLSGFLHQRGATLLTFRDVTRERQTDSELKRTKDFLANLIDSSVDPIIASDPQGILIVFNKAAEEVLGYSAREVLGRRTLEDLYPPGVATEIMRKLRSREPGSRGKLEVHRREVIAKSGEKIPVNLTAALVFQGDEEVATVGIYADLRERLRIQDKLSQAQEKLQLSEKQAVIAELAGATAHELNQPLTSIMGYAELLKKRLDDSSPLRNGVSVILREAERMAEIVRKIGRITKYETKTYVGSTRIVDLDRSIEPEDSSDTSHKG